MHTKPTATPSARDARLSRVFAALADPVRRAILVELREGAKGATKLGARCEISQPAISRHLRVLRGAGLIQTHVQGRNHWCVLHAEGMKDAAAWVERYATFWNGQLDALEQFVTGDDAKGEPTQTKRRGGRSARTRKRRRT